MQSHPRRKSHNKAYAKASDLASKEHITPFRAKQECAISTTELRRRFAVSRESQRSSRRRMREHVNILEKQILDLKRSQEIQHSLALDVRRRNEQLEDENLMLRLKLQETVMAATLISAYGMLSAIHITCRNSSNMSFTGSEQKAHPPRSNV